MNNDFIENGPIMQLHCGDYIDLLHPHFEERHLLDIAHALSQLCRFTGHIKRFYSVAEHCVHTSHLVEAEDALDALMHDAAEAFTGDIASPFKCIVKDLYAPAEKRLNIELARVFNLRYPWSPAVKKADLQMLKIERENYLPPNGIWKCLEGVRTPPIVLHGWYPTVARDQFVHRYAELAR